LRPGSEIMKIDFTKKNGAGNDFVMIDNRSGRLSPSPLSIRALCDRRRGVGADGVILIEAASGVDFRMRYFNADGGEAEMCGNGARCAARFAASLGMGTDDAGVVRLSFRSGAGEMGAVVESGRVAVSMTDATAFEKEVSVPVANGAEIVHLINTGVPHAVRLEPDWHGLTGEQVVTRGRRIRLQKKFAPGGVNVNFVGVGDDGRVKIRTYERGVEGETLACGTGSVAAGVVLSHLGLARSPVKVVTHGGDELMVTFELTRDGATNVILEGPASINFTGTCNLSEKE
ncbi:MAG: diaminopimelate epimerase, partial [bacterium]